MAMSMLAQGWGYLRNQVFPSTEPLRSKGYFVLGMHRSGTSCLTGLLETAGLWLGDVSRWNRHNTKGNLEDKTIQAANNAILSQFGGSWDRPPATIRWSEINPRILYRGLAPYRTHDRWAAKDPRLVLTLEAWLPCVPNHQLIGTFRHPLSVAQSLHKRNRMRIEDGLALWTAYNRRLVYLHRERGFPVVRFDLTGDAYLERFRSVCQTIGLRFDLQAASAFYSQELVSHSIDASAALSGETATLYDYLLRCQVPAAGGRSNSARAA